MCKFNVEEVREVVRACAHIAVPACPPPYLQQFLVCRLEDSHPDVAAKVARLSREQCSELLRVVRDFQLTARDG